MTAPRRRLAPLAAIALLPVVSALVLLRTAPAVGQAADLGLYSMTVLAAGTNTTGDIGAGGGLAPVDSGTPVVRGRLDSSPAASVVAAPVEPGTLFRTAAALANNEVPDQEPLRVPTAASSYPGGPAEDRVSPTDGAGEVPVSSTAATAHTSAGEHAIRGDAEAATQDVTGDGALLRQRQVSASATATASPPDGTLLATATSHVSSVTIAETVTFEDVTGRARLQYADGTVTADADTTYGGIAVAGTPVRLTNDGVVVADDAPALPIGEAATLEDQVNGVLEAAGITIEPLSPVREGGDRSGRADSGGIRVSITTPSSAAVPANVVEVVIGQATATLSTEPPPASTDLPSAAPDTGTAPALPGTSGVDPAPPPAAGPAIAPPATGSSTPDVGAPRPAVAPAEEPQVLLAGRRIPQRTALALLGGWQLLSLSTCTLAAFALPAGRGQRGRGQP